MGEAISGVMVLNIWSAVASTTCTGPSPTLISGPVGALAVDAFRKFGCGGGGNTVLLWVTMASSNFTLYSCVAPPMSPVPT
jgi:hypothetical protein